MTTLTDTQLLVLNAAAAYESDIGDWLSRRPGLA